ncbi:hypothetical protein [Fulvivirga sp.]|uniref:hypothetical protein n=1 Tax=Fulvivirga sp. TaxID=1931237 RepID=UPI0032F09A58
MELYKRSWVILILLLSCQTYTKNEVSELLSDKYFNAEFIPEHELAPITYEFFNDSLYLTTWQNENVRRANMGYWKYNRQTFTMFGLLHTTEFSLNKLTETKIEVANNKGSLSLELYQNSVTDRNLLIGNWVDYSDTIPSPANLFNKDMPFYNPVLRITKDSIYSHIPNIYFSKATYNLLPSSHAIIIEHNKFYTRNPIFMVQSLTTDSLDIVLQSTDGMTYRRKFVRKSSMPSML